jgi:hypothetical protein
MRVQVIVFSTIFGHHFRQQIVRPGHWTQTVLQQHGLHGSTTHFFTTGPGM